MKISQLYVYPIKSLRPTSLSTADVTYQGLQYDRRFLLQKLGEKGKLMFISGFAQMCLFYTDIVFATESSPGRIIVTFKSPETDEEKRLEVPLEPEIEALKLVDVDMHHSTCQGYDMGSKYHDWFSGCFGFPVQLLYVGDNARKVLGNVSPAYVPKGNGWISSLKSNLNYYTTTAAVDRGIGFSDCAPFLVVTQESLDHLNKAAELPADDLMVIEKFRPNVVLSGANDAWEEDFWSEISFDSPDGKLGMKFTANCVRCVSLNVDFRTGKPGKTESGSILKKLSKYRRVDSGAPYSPVFGRYGFMMPMVEGSRMSVGDEVTVTKTEEARSTFYWPGLE